MRNETHQMYFVNVPMGGASDLTNVMVEFGRRFFVFPNDSLSRRKSKWDWGTLKTRASGLPVN
jgi:hypothetical protein